MVNQLNFVKTKMELKERVEEEWDKIKEESKEINDTIFQNNVNYKVKNLIFTGILIGAVFFGVGSCAYHLNKIDKYPLPKNYGLSIK
jgi:hypothetical protein